MINQTNILTSSDITDDSKIFERKKFIRRHDLDVMTRLTIAYTALIAMAEKQRGTITELANEFFISRTFVYMLAKSLLEICQIQFDDMRPSIQLDKSSIDQILSLRLEGKCSLESISTILKRFDIGNSSVGYISELLNDIGSVLPTQTLNNGDQIQVIYVSDEIFAKNSPILITVDPISTAILKIELLDKRTANAWIHHWESIEDNGFVPVYLVCDGGTALAKAHDEYLSDLIKQPDTYHSIAHILGVIDKRFEKDAYDAINKEYKSNKVLTEKDLIDEIKLSKLTNQYEENQKNAQEKIDAYDSFHYLYVSMIKELEIFDETGKRRDRQTAENNIEACLDLLEAEFELTKQVKKIRRILPDLLNYFEIAEVVLEELKKKLPENSDEILELLCLWWQWGKKIRKTKDSNIKRYCAKKERHYYEKAEMKCTGNFDKIKDQVRNDLDEIVQSSSIVECINSIIRPYINNTKTQISQEFLNLIMFYHNHRRYKDGKRTGKIPYEILTGEKQTKDWLDLLKEEYEKNRCKKSTC
jgi:hypothetical protein